MKDDRISGPSAPQPKARLLSTEKESSPCRNPPNPSTPNACFSPVITLESPFFSLSQVLSQPMWRILFTFSQLSFAFPASSPHPGKKLLLWEHPGFLNSVFALHLFSSVKQIKKYPAHPPVQVAKGWEQLGIPPQPAMSCPHSPDCAHGSLVLCHQQWQEGRQS